MYFICPKCGRTLERKEDGAAACSMRHSFDRSREGYYNLLLANGKDHGDNQDMVNARRAFLSQGHYRPLGERIATLSNANTPGGGVLLDAGMGEGYYTELIAMALEEGGKAPGTVLGFDISKEACRKGAKRLSRYLSGQSKVGLEISVASSYRMPLATASVDTLVNVFSPLAPEESRRVLRRGGKLIYVIPGADHLFQLKAKIYDEPYKNTPEEYTLPGFSLFDSEAVRFTMELGTPEEVRSLFMMTPYAYRTGQEGRERLMALRSLAVTADFEILIFERTD